MWHQTQPQTLQIERLLSVQAWSIFFPWLWKVTRQESFTLAAPDTYFHKVLRRACKVQGFQIDNSFGSKVHH